MSQATFQTNIGNLQVWSNREDDDEGFSNGIMSYGDDSKVDAGGDSGDIELQPRHTRSRQSHGSQSFIGQKDLEFPVVVQTIPHTTSLDEPSASLDYSVGNGTENDNRNDHELGSGDENGNNGGSDVLENRNVSALPAVDGGFGAWSYLFAAFLVENIVWGFPNAFGSFLEVYLKDPTFTSQKHAESLLPLIGAVNSGIMYVSAVILYPLNNRYPNYRKPAMWLGAVLCWASLFAASYTTKVPYLIFCQGVLYALGGSIVYTPCIYYMSEWFVAKRGFASGVIQAGTATGGCILPLVVPRVIERYGPNVALRILAVVFGVTMIPFLPFLKGRLPTPQRSGPSQWNRSSGFLRNLRGGTTPMTPRPMETIATNEDRGSGTGLRKATIAWLKNPTFQLLILVSTIEGFGYFIPLIFLPTFASELHLSSTNSSLTLALLNGISIIGRLGAGVLSDRVDPWLLALFIFLGTCISTFILWGVLSSTFAGLIAFGLAYGSLAGGWSSMWPGFMKKLRIDDPRLATNFIAYMMLCRGLGNIISTPIATALSHSDLTTTLSIPTFINTTTTHERMGFDVGGGKYEKVIIYVGTCFTAAAIISLIGWSVEKVKLTGRGRAW